MAIAVESLLDQLGVGSFDLGGLCLGASVACALAKRRPSAVDRLILHTPLVAPNLICARYRRQIQLFTTPVLWDAVVWLSRRRLISDLYKRLVIAERDVDRQTAGINFLNQRRANPRAAREWLQDSLHSDDVQVISARSGPTLIIVAANDRLVHVTRTRQLVAGAANVSLFIDKTATHGWNSAAVNRHLRVLSDFLGDPQAEGGRVRSWPPLLQAAHGGPPGWSGCGVY